ncbi:MAG: glutathione S-transferase family protein [Gammaproteobacteria bacterium]|nr:MAG: glutathione S-transferase family protein [Gammaproteobacteria bacterium]
MIALYGNGQSRSFRALWALEEANMPYEYRHIELGLGSGSSAPNDEYLSMNCQGKVPTLADDDLLITESAAILNYIAALKPSSCLIPGNDPALRARYDQICFFVLSELEQPLWTSGKHRFALPEEKRVLAILGTVHWEFNKALEALNHLINVNEYAVGNRFTMADILVAHTLNWAESFMFEVPGEFQVYRKKMYDRPACKKALSMLTPVYT